jgi:hypothetical protein
LLWRRVRAAIEGLSAQLLRFADRELGPKLLDEAWSDFAGTDDAFDPETRHLPVFMPWSYHGWSPDPHATAFPELAARSATIAGEYVAHRRRHLDPLLIRYLEACAIAAFSFHEVVDVEAGRGFVLRDILLDCETFVVEHSASRMVRPGDILFAQIVVIDGLAMLDGCASIVIEPRDKPEIIELRKRIHGRGDLFGTSLLREWSFEVVELYLAIAKRMLDPSPPELQNTDSEPVAPHTVVFRVNDVDAAAAALDAAALDGGDALVPDDVRRTPAGAVIEASWTWQRAGNAMHKSWDNTTLGHITVTADMTLKLDVNSAGRAARGRLVVERVLAGNVKHRATCIESAESMLAAARKRPTPRMGTERAQLMQQPEVREQLRAILMQHYTDWLDSKVPALGQRTPREAVGDRDGREAVAALIAQIERDGARQVPPLDAAIPTMLRRELGMT